MSLESSKGDKPQPHTPAGNAPKQDLPGTRLFKVLNPELYMKPNRLIMYGGVAALAGVILWLGSDELRHRQNQALAGVGSNESATTGSQRTQTYQERMAELKRESK
ncbi:Multidrug resistance-associated protein 4 [Coemansia spiralis]|uniref:Multidrug resistance-associated protein 4 n=1 Tax=Coemansia spiralis TaxID=417178 RepID=A0A9W8L1X2_9FUNG|nr:Multidrug resistance-associated protein 4 [Coemansia spiralis]